MEQHALNGKISPLKAVEAIVRTGNLPVNLKFLIEGEEEVGSPHLEHFIKKNKAKLGCDFSLNPDAGMISSDTPTITYALRGLCFFELTLRGPDHDLHSGSYTNRTLNTKRNSNNKEQIHKICIMFM